MSCHHHCWSDFCHSQFTTLIHIVAVEQIPPNTLRFDLDKQVICRQAPADPKKGKYSDAENHIWLDYYITIHDKGKINGKGWQGMREEFLKNGFNRTCDSLREHVSNYNYTNRLVNDGEYSNQLHSPNTTMIMSFTLQYAWMKNKYRELRDRPTGSAYVPLSPLEQKIVDYIYHEADAEPDAYGSSYTGNRCRHYFTSYDNKFSLTLNIVYLILLQSYNNRGIANFQCKGKDPELANLTMIPTIKRKKQQVCVLVCL